MKKNLKIYLYLGNHNNYSGIIDYINYIKNLAEKFCFKFSCGNTLMDKTSNDIVIIIEEFSKISQLLKIFLFFRIFKKKKLLILTEFFDKKSKTLNFPHFSIHIFFKLLLFMSLVFFWGKIVLKLLNIIFFIFIKIIKYSYLIILNNFRFFFGIVLVLLFIKKGSPIKKINNFENSIKKILNNINKFLELILNLAYEDFYFFKRYLGLTFLLNRFDSYLVSHPAIKFDTKKKINVIFFPIKNKNYKLSKNKNFAFEFSGQLNFYRKSVIKNIIYKENLYKTISNKFLLNLDSKKENFRKFNSKEYNFLSLHIKKTKNWLYSSPTRYVNSIEKNYIPIVLNNFYEYTAKTLAIHINKIQYRSNSALFNLEKKIRNNIKIYNNNVKLSLNKIYRTIEE